MTAVELAKRVNQPKHVWNYEESNVGATNVDLVEMADTPVARSNRNIFQLDVHVVFSYTPSTSAPLFYIINMEKGYLWDAV